MTINTFDQSKSVPVAQLVYTKEVTAPCPLCPAAGLHQGGNGTMPAPCPAGTPRR